MHAMNTHRAYSSWTALLLPPPQEIKLDHTCKTLQDMHPKKEFIPEFSPGIPFKYISRAISPSNDP